MVHYRYGSSVQLPRLPTPPRGGAVEGAFRREQPNSTGETLTRIPASFTGAGFAVFSGMAPGQMAAGVIGFTREVCLCDDTCSSAGSLEGV